VDFIQDGGSGSMPVQDSAAFDALIGRTVANNFRLVKRIGSGAMGRVYQAEQLSLGKMVAIKILRHELMADDKLLRRFEMEARTASAMSHPNLVETFDCGRDAALDLAYIAMELLPGPDLSQVIAREAPLSLQRSARIMDQVLAALEETHLRGIVHRDLKPGNIMLVPRRDESDFVKVCDFGIAKAKSSRGRPSLTLAGLVFGTPEYMSPEQACGGDVDARTDLYAVAAILYQLVSGRLPFPAPSPTEVLARILRDEPERPSLRSYEPIPAPIEDLILRGLSKDRELRPQTAAEFRIYLRDAWAGVMDYWPGQSTALPTLSLRAATPVPRAGSAERPVVASDMTPTRPAATPIQPTPPPGSPAPGSPPPSGIHTMRSAILGFTLTLACGGIALWAVTMRRSEQPKVDGTASVATAPSNEGMIVVPTALSEHEAAPGQRRGTPSSRPPAAVRHAPIGHVARRLTARGKAHRASDPRADQDAEATSPTAGPVVASRSPSTPGALDPRTEPSPAEPIAPAVGSIGARTDGPASVAAGRTASGIAHKLRATSIPSEAEVLVDGKLIGHTPLFGAEVDIRQTHTLTIRKDGYAPYEQPVSASSGWVVRSSDNAAALRITTVLQKLDRTGPKAAVLRPGDPTLAQNPVPGP
jgi:serine/threonine protein kinase